MAIYEGPTNILWYVAILFIIMLTLYLDIAQKGYTNLIVFFITTVVVPVMFVAMATSTTGAPFLRMIGITGSLLSNIAMLLFVSGITVLFFIPITTYSVITTGMVMAPQFQVVYSPMSAVSLKTLTVFPTTYLLGFYLVVALGEEILKHFGMRTATNWVYVHIFRRRFSERVTLVTLGVILSWVGWILIHAVGNPAVVSVGGFATGFLLSIIWFVPFFLLAESLSDPKKGINLKFYSIIGSVGGHWTWDVLVETVNYGQIISNSSLFLFGIGAVAGGLALLAYEYKSRNLPIFGYLKI